MLNWIVWLNWIARNVKNSKGVNNDNRKYLAYPEDDLLACMQNLFYYSFRLFFNTHTHTHTHTHTYILKCIMYYVSFLRAIREEYVINLPWIKIRFINIFRFINGIKNFIFKVWRKSYWKRKGYKTAFWMSVDRLITIWSKSLIFIGRKRTICLS